MSAPEVKIKQKSRTRNLFGIQVAPIIQNDTSAYKAGAKIDLAGAITMKLTENYNTENLYSDGNVEEPLGQFIDGDGEMEINRLAPQERDILLNQTFKNGFLMKSADDTPQELALSFISELKDGLLEFTQLYAVIFNQGDEITYNTKAEKVETTTNTLKFKYYGRKYVNMVDGKRKHFHSLVLDEEQMLEEYRDAKAAIDNWMTAVQEPVLNASTPATGLTLTSAAGTTSGKTAVTVTPDKASGNSYRYKTGVAVAMPALSADLTSWEAWDGTANIEAATGNDLVIAEVDSSGKCKKAGKIVVTAKS